MATRKDAGVVEKILDMFAGGHIIDTLNTAEAWVLDGSQTLPEVHHAFTVLLEVSNMHAFCDLSLSLVYR